MQKITLHELNEVFSSKNIKQVTMRYEGREYRGRISEVNYLAEKEGFLGYSDILEAKLPENEIFEMGMLILEEVKPTWTHDWGGRGEIRWEPGKPIKVFHLDRYEKDIADEVELPERLLANAIKAAELPQTELRLLKAVNAEFDVMDGKPLFSKLLGSGDEEGSSLSPALSGKLHGLFSAAYSLVAAKTKASHVKYGEVIWRIGSDFSAKLQGVSEFYRSEDFVLPKHQNITLV